MGAASDVVWRGSGGQGCDADFRATVSPVAFVWEYGAEDALSGNGLAERAGHAGDDRSARIESGELEDGFEAETWDEGIGELTAWVGDVLDIGLEAEVVSDLVLVEEFDGRFVFSHGDVLIGVAGLEATAEEGVGETEADDVLIAAGEEAFVYETAAVVFLDSVAITGSPAELEEGAESLIVFGAIALFEEHLVAGEEEAIVLVEGSIGVVEIDPKIVS